MCRLEYAMACSKDIYLIQKCSSPLGVMSMWTLAQAQSVPCLQLICPDCLREVITGFPNIPRSSEEFGTKFAIFRLREIAMSLFRPYKLKFSPSDYTSASALKIEAKGSACSADASTLPILIS